MFWINYLLLCGQAEKTPTGLARELGISSGTVTGWKKGKIPSEASLKKIADYFGISIWDLLGDKNPDTPKDDGNKKESLNDELIDYAISLFSQLPIEQKIQIITELRALTPHTITQETHLEATKTAPLNS